MPQPGPGLAARTPDVYRLHAHEPYDPAPELRRSTQPSSQPPISRVNNAAGQYT